VVFGREISGIVEDIVDKGFRQLRDDTETTSRSSWAC